MVKPFFWCTSYGSSNAQAAIILNGFQVLIKRHVIRLIIKDITLIKMGSDKSFICCDKCSFWQKILQFTKETYSFTYFIFLGTIFIWSSNFNWLSSIIRKCFWEDVRVTLTLLNSNVGCTIFFYLRLKMTFWACLVVSGLKFIFYWVS